jgi:xylulokinase
MATTGYLLGYDVGSSSIKATLLDAGSGKVVASATSPAKELEIIARHPGWAEQHPELWWEHARKVTTLIKEKSGVDMHDVKAIGISYQMHGLVIVDKNLKVLRPAIIWCDSRAVPIGAKAFSDIGEQACLEHLLNSPGNFTASKLKWVKDNEPDIYNRIYKMMLPGDFIAMMMTGEIKTTPSGLSEGILWDYPDEKIADLVLDQYGISPDLIPEVVPTFSVQGTLTRQAAEELGLKPDTTVSYRAGDQPNNAFSLKVLNQGEIAATAGTSGVVYGVSHQPKYDPQSRVNTFIHVNHERNLPRYGILLCVNGTGILNSWVKKNMMMLGNESVDYGHMNDLTATVPVGSQGLVILPYGNGVERTLGNRNIRASVHGLEFNIHTKAHILRATQEGIVFALNYGLEIMRDMGIEIKTVRAGHANMFLSSLFGEAFATITGAVVELYNTDGPQGAARGAGLGAGIYKGVEEAFVGLGAMRTIEPNSKLKDAYQEAYNRWHETLMIYMQ